MTCDLRLGRWQDVLADVGEVDAVICDPPYSARVESGVRSGSTKAQRNQIGMEYQPIDEAWVAEWVSFWNPRCRAWIVVYGDHITASWFERALALAGRYTFAPLPLVKRGAAPRMCADGPASQTEWIVCARPKSAAHVGTWPGLPGWYFMETVRHGHGHAGVRGAKSVEHMRAIVRDYSRPGDLVVDPCAGGGTTLLAARMEGRRAIGAEMDPDTHAKAAARLAHMPQERQGQTALWGGE